MSGAELKAVTDGNPVSSIVRMPWRTGSKARKACQNGRTAEDECVMKCCRPW